MKSFAILLIILNIGFFTWLQGWLDWMPWQPQDIVPPAQTAKPSKSDLPTLTLLNEKIEKPATAITVANAEQVKPEVKAESPKTAKPETLATAEVSPVEKPAAEIIKTPEPVKVEKVETAPPQPAAAVEAPKVAVTEPTKTEKVEPISAKTVVETPVETLASAVKIPETIPSPEVKETKEKSEAMEIPAPAVITPENNPIATFIGKAKAVVAQQESSGTDKPSDTGITAPPKDAVKEPPIEQTATPTTTMVNPLPVEVLNAMAAVKPESQPKTETTASAPVETGTTTQNLNSSSTLTKNSAIMPSSSSVAEASVKSLQAVKKEDKTALKSNDSNELCFVAGPYSLLSNAQNSAKWFRGKSKVQVEIQADEVPTVFWVYLPPYKNQKEANRQAQHLAHLGITDYVLVTTGQLKHAISLGVYRDQASAQRRVNELHRKAYKRARLEKQRQGNKRYWLSVKMSAMQKNLMLSFKRAQKVSAIEVNVCE